MKSILFSIVIFLSGSSFNHTLVIQKSSSDIETEIKKTVENAYAAISFKKGETPDYEALKAVFTPNATFLNFRQESLSYSVRNDFVAGFREAVESGEITSFYEKEITGKTEHFGKIAHRISSYATYLNNAKTITERGVNSFQLVNVDGKWLVNSIIWDIESNELPIPSKYDKGE